MSDTPRKKVNILEICQAKEAAASKRIEESKAALKAAEAQVSSIQAKHKAELEAAHGELTKISNLIQDNEKEGIDTQKLEKKATDIKQRIARLSEEHLNSADLVAAKREVEKSSGEIELAEKSLELCKLQSGLAWKLKKSHEAAPSHGAVEALEFETLNEAIDEYIANIPLVVSISKAMTIDKVALWQAPEVSEPAQYDLSATKGKTYRYSRIPDSLRWLQRFPKTKYATMPSGNDAVIESEGIPFLVGVDASAQKAVNEEANEEGAGDEGSSKEGNDWMGEMKSFYHNGYSHGRQVLKAPQPSIYFPDGISNNNRCGLCYIKSEDKFYAIWNTEFAVVEMVPGKVQKRDYYNRIVEEDGIVPKGVVGDMSGLLEDFFTPMEEKLEAVAKGFSELAKSEEPLVKRVAKAVQAVGVLDAPFEARIERLTGAEIEKEVGAYWDAFVGAPWEGALTGNVAMIKHLCERKLETPHVWSYSVKGHYGLRVRTRDHDWIVAEIYCPPSDFSPKEKISHDSVIYLRNQYGRCENFIKVGPCFINVVGRKE